MNAKSLLLIATFWCFSSATARASNVSGAQEERIADGVPAEAAKPVELPPREIKLVHPASPIIRQPTREVTIAEVKTRAFQHAIDDLIELTLDKDGLGMAANQVGWPVRVAVAKIKDPETNHVKMIEMINPKFTPIGKETTEYLESCLSVPLGPRIVSRPGSVAITYMDRHGKQHSFTVSGAEAHIVQQELEHLDGRRFIDCKAKTFILPYYDCAANYF